MPAHLDPPPKNRLYYGDNFTVLCGYLLILCIALPLASVLTGCRSQPIPTLKGQSLGETFNSLVAKSPDLQRIIRTCKDSLSADCTQVNELTPNYSGILHCSDETETLDICENTPGEFIFRDGKLTAMMFKERNTWQPSLGLLTAKYGKPSEIVNGVGKLSDAIGAIWSAQGYRLSLNGFQDDPSNAPTVCIILQTPEHYAKAGQQQEKAQADHDGILANYREAIKRREKDQAQLEQDEREHKDQAFISSDKMMLIVDDGGKLDELFLNNEVREDESSGAIY